MKEFFKNRKGITLIALVITIIVLLILAGVSIVTLTGDNGILTQVDKAKTQTAKAGAEEQVRLAVISSYGTDGELDYKLLKTNLEKIEGISGVPDTITENSFPLTVEVGVNDMKITEDGQVLPGFDANEWDKTACKESSFLWESDDPASGEAYHTIVGYADSITNETKLKIPTRCHELKCKDTNWYSQGRTFIIQTFDKVELPETIVKIGDFAFAYFKIASIEIPNSVTSIGSQAFVGCSSLTTMKIPNNVTSIESGAFSGCSGLTSINIPDGVTNLKSGVFNACSSLISIEIPDTVTSIESGVFSNCSNLTNIEIPGGLTSIDTTNLFQECSSLKRIELPDCVTSIDWQAFKNCISLEEIIMPDIVTEISEEAFEGCEKLRSITIPSNLKTVGWYAFRGCKGIATITIPNTVTSVGTEAFSGWESSQTINVKGYSSAPSGWYSDWRAGCSAKINWNQ